MTRKELEKLGEKLAEFVKTDEAKGIFFWHTGSSEWDRGGCYALAYVLQNWLTRKGVDTGIVGMGYYDTTIIQQRVIAHVVLEISGTALFLDANGIHSFSGKIDLYENTAFPLRRMVITDDDLENFEHDDDFIGALEFAMEKFLA